MADTVLTTLQNYKEDPLPAALVAIGGAVVLKFAWGQLLNNIYKYFFRPSPKLYKLGKYAVITGATDGIGKAYAFALAKRGMSLILISRTESKLQDVAKEIDAKNYKGIEKTKYIVCDYSKFDEQTRARVQKELEGLDIGVLVNNVGQSYRYPRFFHELPNDEIAALIEMNINSTVWMTKFVIDGMVQRKKGHILNLSSASAEYTMPLLAEYAAAKMFVERFSESLDAEYRAKGITVQCQVPFYVATKLAKMRKSLMVPTADEYAKMSMMWIGHSGVVSPYWLHAVQGWVMANLPSFIVDRQVMNMHLGIRKRGMKKDERLAAEGKKE
eukprot:CCRYP_006567-RA/>CCRYP_006567-RA protein AED:0.32 eAED:0.32 QI:94/0.5/0.66/1/0/0.33/3/486/327